jgi:hypothetical protein
MAVLARETVLARDVVDKTGLVATTDAVTDPSAFPLDVDAEDEDAADTVVVVDLVSSSSSLPSGSLLECGKRLLRSAAAFLVRRAVVLVATLGLAPRCGFGGGAAARRPMGLIRATMAAAARLRGSGFDDLATAAAARL